MNAIYVFIYLILTIPCLDIQAYCLKFINLLTTEDIKGFYQDISKTDVFIFLAMAIEQFNKKKEVHIAEQPSAVVESQTPLSKSKQLELTEEKIRQLIKCNQNILNPDFSKRISSSLLIKQDISSTIQSLAEETLKQQTAANFEDFFDIQSDDDQEEIKKQLEEDIQIKILKQNKILISDPVSPPSQIEQDESQNLLQQQEPIFSLKGKIDRSSDATPLSIVRESYSSNPNQAELLLWEGFYQAVLEIVLQKWPCSFDRGVLLDEKIDCITQKEKQLEILQKAIAISPWEIHLRAVQDLVLLVKWNKNNEKVIAGRIQWLLDENILAEQFEKSAQVTVKELTQRLILQILRNSLNEGTFEDIMADIFAWALENDNEKELRGELLIETWGILIRIIAENRYNKQEFEQISEKNLKLLIWWCEDILL